MKKEENNEKEEKPQFLNTLESLTLLLCMLNLFTACSAKEGLETDLEKISKTLHNFSNEVDKAVSDEGYAEKSSVVISSGNKLITELDTLRQKMDAHDNDILELISKAQQLTNDIIA